MYAILALLKPGEKKEEHTNDLQFYKNIFYHILLDYIWLIETFCFQFHVVNRIT